MTPSSLNCSQSRKISQREERLPFDISAWMHPMFVIHLAQSNLAKRRWSSHNLCWGLVVADLSLKFNKSSMSWDAFLVLVTYYSIVLTSILPSEEFMHPKPYNSLHMSVSKCRLRCQLKCRAVNHHPTQSWFTHSRSFFHDSISCFSKYFRFLVWSFVSPFLHHKDTSIARTIFTLHLSSSST